MMDNPLVRSVLVLAACALMAWLLLRWFVRSQLMITTDEVVRLLELDPRFRVPAYDEVGLPDRRAYRQRMAMLERARLERGDTAPTVVEALRAAGASNARVLALSEAGILAQAADVYDALGRRGQIPEQHQFVASLRDVRTAVDYEVAVAALNKPLPAITTRPAGGDHVG